MSKSLGNFVTIHELVKEWPGVGDPFDCYVADALSSADQLDRGSVCARRKILAIIGYGMTGERIA